MKSLKKIFCFVSCEVLVQFCEIHGQFYASNDDLTTEGEMSCCQAIFNPQPIFDYAGTCYTTNQPILEFTPYIYSTITIWLNSMRLERQMSKKQVFENSN